MKKQEAMSSKKIDELFRSKLEGHPVGASPEAWAKLQGKMNPSGRKKGAYWMSIAAGVSLLLLAGWVFYQSGENDFDPANSLAGKEVTEATVVPKLPVEEKQEDLIAAHQQTEKAPVADHSTTASKQPEKKNNRPVQPAATQAASDIQINEVKAETMVALESIENVEEVTEEANIPEPIEIATADAPLVAEAKAPVAPLEVKITFKADEDERFLDPVRELIASELPKEKKNGFNKLLASAKTLGERNIIAELREGKDELFSGSLKLGAGKHEKVNNSK
jgi:hypothetical protein